MSATVATLETPTTTFHVHRSAAGGRCPRPANASVKSGPWRAQPVPVREPVDRVAQRQPRRDAVRVEAVQRVHAAVEDVVEDVGQRLRRPEQQQRLGGAADPEDDARAQRGSAGPREDPAPGRDSGRDEQPPVQVGDAARGARRGRRAAAPTASDVPAGAAHRGESCDGPAAAATASHALARRTAAHPAPPTTAGTGERGRVARPALGGRARTPGSAVVAMPTHRPPGRQAARQRVVGRVSAG